MFRAAIAKVVAWSCSFKTAGPSFGGNSRTFLWTAGMRDAFRLKEESYRAWLACESPDWQYWQTKQWTALMGNRSFSETTEENFQLAPRDSVFSIKQLQASTPSSFNSSINSFFYKIFLYLSHQGKFEVSVLSC